MNKIIDGNGNTLLDLSDEKFELIETINITEEGITVIERNAESDGTPYNFTAMSIKGIIKKLDVNGTIDVCAKKNSAWNKAYRRFGFGTVNNNGDKVFSCIICNMYGKQFSIDNSPESNLSFISCRSASGNICTMDWENVTELSIALSGNNNNGFPVGSSIEIYAVRA